MLLTIHLPHTAQFKILTICKNPDTQLLYCTCSVLSFLGEESEGDQFRIDTRGDCSVEMGRIAGWLVIIFGKRDWGEKYKKGGGTGRTGSRKTFLNIGREDEEPLGGSDYPGQ